MNVLSVGGKAVGGIPVNWFIPPETTSSKHIEWGSKRGQSWVPIEVSTEASQRRTNLPSDRHIPGMEGYVPLNALSAK
jgi:hypothetical protein